MTQVTQTLHDGQLTIPISIRRKMGIANNARMQLIVQGGILQLCPINSVKEQKGSTWLKDLYRQFASVREEAQAMSEKEIESTITRAVKAVRQSHA